MDLSVLPTASPEIPAAAGPSEIERSVEALLRRSGYLALRDVSSVARGGVVYLCGRLPSYYFKQLAQELAAGVDGVRRVINRIEVVTAGQRPAVGRDRAPTEAGVSPSGSVGIYREELLVPIGTVRDRGGVVG
jgi:hypothetical protein